uniref:Uncharacterized protein n=1 Tax=Meloidogyne enterolobii TaxID=390850 RepID=A0A6V7XCQ5_MELEN|nr:unnamed protein product [Meloidogyne enterolobii]
MESSTTSNFHQTNPQSFQSINIGGTKTVRGSIPHVANPTLKNVAKKSEESSESQKSFQESSTESEGKDEFDLRLRKYATNSDTPNSSDDESLNSNADQYNSLPKIPQMVMFDNMCYINWIITQNLKRFMLIL